MIIIAVICLLTRMKKIDMLSVFRNRKIQGGSRRWYGWGTKSKNSTPQATQSYKIEGTTYGFPSDEKSIPPQRQLDAFFSPITKPPPAIPQTAATLLTANSQRYDAVREALLNNPDPIGISRSRSQDTKYHNPSYYTHDPYYNNIYNTNATYVTQNTANAYDPTQGEVNHLSYLSSLSSGFGDAQIIIPESGPTKQSVQGTPQSSHQSRKFSWVSSVPGLRRQGDRDTVYTMSSVESAPRFRSVNSWVAQQTGHVERRKQIGKEIPAMPGGPLPLQIGITHRRKMSEDPAFKYHPGDEVEISRGGRIPSAILDRKTGVR